MEICHRITFGHIDKVDDDLASLKIRCKRSPLPGNGYLIHVDICESDERWASISELVKVKSALDMYDTVFTPEEIIDSEYNRLIPVFEQGYPQPEKNGLWKASTYDSWCQECGTGYQQIHPFVIKKEPVMRNKDFVSLYWTYGISATQQVEAKVKAAGLRGVEVWPVMLHRENTPSEVISQLMFPHVAEPSLVDRDKLDPEPCSECKTTKYAFHKRGYMHLKRTALRHDVDAQHSHEWFGSDTKWGFQEILISNRFARIIIDERWKGVVLKPVKLI